MLASFDQSLRFLSSVNSNLGCCPCPHAVRTQQCCAPQLSQATRKPTTRLCSTSQAHVHWPGSAASKSSRAVSCQSAASRQATVPVKKLSIWLLPFGAHGVLWPQASRAQEAEGTFQEASQAASTDGAANSLIAFLFTGSVIALGVITLGTIYLSLSQFIDSRNEKADLSKWTPDERNSKSPAVKKQPSSKRKQYVSAKGGGKGFGDFGPGESEF